MTTPAAQTPPRTIRDLLDAAAAVELDGHRVEIRWHHEGAFTVYAPRRWRDTGSQEVYVAPIAVGRVGWYVRDGRAHIGGALAEVRRAIANLAEGRDPLRPRRDTVTGTFPGRDRAGRFTPDTRRVGR